MRATLPFVLLALVGPVPIAEGQARKTPYWASIAAGKARMRTGPGRNYPASWLYQRPDLPIRVIGLYKEWRRVEDPGGAQGWMQANLLTDRRTGYVTDQIVTLRASPAPSARVLWRAAPGVVGRISRCSAGWCWYDINGRAGFVEAIHLYGVDPNEQLP